MATRTSTRIPTLGRLALVLVTMIVLNLDQRASQYAQATTILSLYLAYLIIRLAWVTFRPNYSTAWYEPWLDVGTYTLVLALVPDALNIVLAAFTYAVVEAAMHHSSGVMLQIGTVTMLVTSMIALIHIPSSGMLVQQPLIVGPLLLTAVSGLALNWKRRETALQQQLELISRVTVSNPYLGLNRSLGGLLEQLRRGYKVDECVSIIVEQATGEALLRRADRTDPEHAIIPEKLPAAVAELFLTIPMDYAAVYTKYTIGYWIERTLYSAYHLSHGTASTQWHSVSERIAATLNLTSFITIPVRYGNTAFGRLYLGTYHARRFSVSDITLLIRVLEHTAPLINAISLIEQLTIAAAERERQRIARDLHDSVIQPYVGLQLGLSAVRHKLAAGRDITNDIGYLITVTNDEITELRDYVHTLQPFVHRGTSLVEALQRSAAKFTETTGIVVQIQSNTDLSPRDHLAAEILQIVAEGFSNIRRHTDATLVRLHLSRNEDQLVLRIENDTPAARTWQDFTPKSIVERAAALGGEAHVEQAFQGGVAVVVTIPL